MRGSIVNGQKQKIYRKKVKLVIHTNLLLKKSVQKAEKVWLYMQNIKNEN